MYLLSVCIPVYDAERFLPACLEPLTKMGEEVQILLSDDGSKDRSLELCEEYARKYDNIFVIRGENGGPSAARNRALKEVKGEYTIFCDADDWLETEVFWEFKRVIEKRKYDLIHFGVTVEEEKRTYRHNLLYTESKELTDSEYHDLFSLVCGYEDDRDLSFPAFGLVTCKFFRTGLLKGLAFDPTVVGEDTLYAVEAMQNVRSAYFLAGHYYHYRIVEGSYSHKPFPKIVPMAAKMLRLLYDTLNIKDTGDAIIKKAYYFHAFGKFRWCVSATGLREIRDDRERAERLKELCRIPEFRDMLRKISISGFSDKGKVIVMMLRFGIYGFPARHLILK